METLVDNGKVRSIGVSNFTLEQLTMICNGANKIQPIVNQVEYHVYLQQKSLYQGCLKLNVHLVAYSPLASGKNTTVYNDPIIVNIANKHSTKPSCIALAYLLSQNLVIIPRTSSLQHLEENFTSTSIILDQHDIQQLSTLNQNKREFNPITFRGDNKPFFTD
uniref:Aldose reductase C n=1 Tax=Lygus hesperus TaxID=30085 RepID=A0A0A9W7H1_LYGHE